MVNTVWVNAVRGRDLRPLADHITKLRNFTKEDNRDFSAFRFSHHLMIEQALINLTICLMISQKQQRASMLQWKLGRFVFSQN